MNLRTFLARQIIFRLHILNSHGTMLFNKRNVKLVASGNMAEKAEQPQGFGEKQKVARRGGNVAGVTRKALEAETGKPLITAQNAESFRQLATDIVTDSVKLPEQTEEGTNGKRNDGAQRNSAVR